MHLFKTQPLNGKFSIDVEQQNLVKFLVNCSLYSTALPLASESDKLFRSQHISQVQQLLQQHPDFQELVLAPLSKLTQAFIEDLIEKAQIPIVLVLDNYDQAPPEIDFWLREYLLASNILKTESNSPFNRRAALLVRTRNLAEITRRSQFNLRT